MLPELTPQTAHARRGCTTTTLLSEVITIATQQATAAVGPLLAGLSYVPAWGCTVVGLWRGEGLRWRSPGVLLPAASLQPHHVHAISCRCGVRLLLLLLVVPEHVADAADMH